MFLGIGVGGLINTRKIELVHMVLKDIAMFHNRHRRQPLLKCCNDLNRMKIPIHSITTDMKGKHSATICEPINDNLTDKFVFSFLSSILSHFFLIEEFQNLDIIVIDHFLVPQQQQRLQMNSINVVLQILLFK